MSSVPVMKAFSHVFSDLDDTFIAWSTPGLAPGAPNVPESVYNARRDLQAAGVKVIPCTGRSLRCMELFKERHELDIPLYPAIYNDGAIILDHDNNRHVTNSIPTDEVNAILFKLDNLLHGQREQLSEPPLIVLTTPDRQWVVNHEECPKAQKNFDTRGSTKNLENCVTYQKSKCLETWRVMEFDRENPPSEVLQIRINLADHAEVPTVLQSVNDLLGSTYQVEVMYLQNVTISPKGADKAFGVRWFLHHIEGVVGDHPLIATIGDGMNDRPMLDLSSSALDFSCKSFVMEWRAAKLGLNRVADVVVPCAGSGGWELMASSILGHNKLVEQVDVTFVTMLALQAADMLPIRVGGTRDVTDLTVSPKSTAVDLVTEFDQGLEAFVSDELKLKFPDHSILGEETAVEGYELTDEPTWVIDPIDGTANFARGSDHFTISIALCYFKEPVLGVVYQPALDRCYVATRGGGSRLMSLRSNFLCKVLDVRRPCAAFPRVKCIGDALIATGFAVRLKRGEQELRKGSTAAAIAHDGHETVQRNCDALLNVCRDLRRFGACSLDICLVAEGQVDAALEVGPREWDYAAAYIVGREAGVAFCHYDGGTPFKLDKLNYIAASSRELMKEIAEVVRLPTLLGIRETQDLMSRISKESKKIAPQY